MDRKNPFTALYFAVVIIAANLLGLGVLIQRGLVNDPWGFDKTILLAMRSVSDLGHPVGGPGVERFFISITGLGSSISLMVIAIIFSGYLVLAGKRGSALLAFVSITGGYTLNTVLKQVFQRPRPDVISHLVDVHTYSFPSGHAMFSTVTFVTLALVLGRLQPHWHIKAYMLSMAIVLVLLIGISRIYLGVHWPSDVIAGWLTGASWVAICFSINSWFQQNSRF